jgi:hypothetical protein
MVAAKQLQEVAVLHYPGVLYNAVNELDPAGLLGSRIDCKDTLGGAFAAHLAHLGGLMWSRIASAISGVPPSMIAISAIASQPIAFAILTLPFIYRPA